ncbi:MAG: hypothetical protein QF876_15195 [Desulfobacterales bacterium]|jgi:hypothetical protein|nr:hypothetical protein [Desulfobacterales bacterium]MDP6808160.1 hypothetical protein [Desulfobacterales bacterium]
MEYAAPLMEQIKGEKAMNVAMQFSGLFWNYALSVQEGTTDRKLEEEILKAAKLSLGNGIFRRFPLTQ